MSVRGVRDPGCLLNAVDIGHELLRRLWVPQQIALQSIAAQRGEETLLGVGLDPLSHNPQAQCLTQRDNGRHNGRVITVVLQITDKTAVNLEFVDSCCNTVMLASASLMAVVSVISRVRLLAGN